MLEDDLKAVTKPQYVDQIPKAIKGTNRKVGFLIESRAEVSDERTNEIAEKLGELRNVSTNAHCNLLIVK